MAETTPDSQTFEFKGGHVKERGRKSPQAHGRRISQPSDLDCLDWAFNIDEGLELSRYE